MDPITMMLIGSLGMQGTGLLTSLLGGRQPSGMRSSGIQPNEQFRSPFTMPDVYKRNQEQDQYASDPRRSILGGADSLARMLRVPQMPSKYFGQYINY
jgi:hypothetical protein